MNINDFALRLLTSGWQRGERGSIEPARWMGFTVVGIVVLAMTLGGCGNPSRPQNSDGSSSEKILGPLVFGKTEKARAEENARATPEAQATEKEKSFFEKLTSPGGNPEENSNGGGLAVVPGTLPNDYLWRGALEVAGNLPIRQFDRVAGLIITDWYEPVDDRPTGSPRERFRLNVMISTRDFRSEGVQVVAFHERLDGTEWVPIQVDPTLSTAIADQILRAANRLRQTAIGASG